MGKKKKTEKKEKPWYCDREFDDEEILISHQKTKHFKCDICHKRLYTVPGLVIHCMQVHKEEVKEVPASIPGRNNTKIEIFGMEGIPEEDVRARRGEATDDSDAKRLKTEPGPQQPFSAPGFPGGFPQFPGQFPPQPFGYPPQGPPPGFPMPPPGGQWGGQPGMPPQFPPQFGQQGPPPPSQQPPYGAPNPGQFAPRPSILGMGPQGQFGGPGFPPAAPQPGGPLFPGGAPPQSAPPPAALFPAGVASVNNGSTPASAGTGGPPAVSDPITTEAGTTLIHPPEAEVSLEEVRLNSGKYRR